VTGTPADPSPASAPGLGGGLGGAPTDPSPAPADAPAPSVRGALGSLRALREGLAAGRWTPSDVVDAVVALRREAPDATWIDLVPAAELRAAAARLSDEGPGGRPLWGVPFAVKGNIDVAGLPTTAGCPGYATGPAAADATAVARLVAAGALPVGTTNLDQFATGLVGTRSPYGAPHAHGHPGWVSGGSSSGSAVVVAAGHVPFSLGTDTAGSGRVPAALNGIASVKPTRGLVSAAGVVPACRSLDCVAVFAATPADAAAVAALAAGLDPADPWGRAAPATPAAEATRPAGPPRVGVPAPGPWADAMDEAGRAAEAASRRRMAGLGWQLVDVDAAPFLAAGDLLYGGAFVAERFAAVGPAVLARPEGLDPVVAGIIGAAEALPAWQVFVDLDRLQGYAAATAPVWDTVDALALPTVPTTFTHAAVAADPLGTNRTLGTFTNFVNLLDLAAAVAPADPRPDGHPYGVQLVGPAFSDTRLASLAQALAEAAPAG
jgi:allophanate hydrolase